MTLFQQRLKEAMHKADVRATDLCAKTGISKSRISQYVNGYYRPKGDALKTLAAALNVSAAWLLGYDVSDYAPEITDDYVTFPVLGEIAAGYEHTAIEDWEGDVISIPIQYLRGRPKTDYFVLKVTGNSMLPDFQAGDKLLVLKQSTMDYSGQIGAVIYDNECATLKQVIYRQGENWVELRPLNSAQYSPIRIENADLEKCRVIGVPKVLIRELN